MIKRMAERTCALVAMLLVLTACNTINPADQQKPLARAASLEALQTFRVTGGLGVWSSKESISTRVDWQQNNDDFNVQVTAPAGLTSVRVIQQGDTALVQRQGDQPVYGSSAAQLLQQVLAIPVSIPIEQMSLWIRGLPGDAEKARYDKAGRLTSMEYRDSQGTLWFARVSKYTNYKSHQVPGLISASGGLFNVRLVLKSWGELNTDIQGQETNSAKSTGRLAIPGK